MEQMLLKRLSDIIARISALTEDGQKYCDLTSFTDEQRLLVEITIQKLEIFNKRFCSELNNYFRLSTDPSPDDISNFSSIQLKGEECLTELTLKLKQSIIRMPTEHASKLPKLTLPQFSGNVLEWPEFWDYFSSNIHQRDLPDIDKLLYLKTSLKGEAKLIIEGLETTTKNYEIAIKTLKERFGKPNFIIDAHYAALHKIKTATNTAASCRKTLNEIERHLRVLESLGEDVNQNHLRFIITEKFPEELIYETKMGLKIESVQEIRKKLETIVTAREDAARTVDGIEKENHYTTETLHIREEEFSRTQKPKPIRFNAGFKKGSLKGIKGNDNKSKFSKTNNNIHKRKFGENGNKEEPQKKKIKLICIFCGESHYNDECDKVKTVTERLKKLTGRCYLCFRKGHTKRNCHSKRNCNYCSKLHNRALCSKKLSEAAAPEAGNIQLNESNNTFKCKENCYTLTNAIGTSYLQTATVKIHANNTTTSCRLLLDCGSQRSYITSQLAKRLKLQPDKEDLLLVYTFGSNEPKEIESASVKITLITKRNIEKTIKANIVPHITDRVPIPNVSLPQGLDVLADDGSIGEKIDMLLGNDYYFSFIWNEHLHLKDDLYLINTDFGWVLSGSTMNREEDNVLSVITYCQCHNRECPYFTEPDLPLREIDIRFLWTLENIGITDSPKVTQQEEAVKHFNDTVEYRDKRYFVKWPWVQYPPNIPTNYGLAYGRLKGLLRRLDEDTLHEYEEILNEQMKAGIIESIDQQQTDHNQQTTPPIHYLPHHIVKQEGKRGRIVYDASAKTKDNRSLNEAMYKGPSLLEDLTGLLLKFRTGKIGITGDVEKAFLQIGLQEEDRDVTRFLWIKNHKEELTPENLLHLRFCRVPFGIISSPFLLTATIRYHLSKNNEELLKKISDRCYVDNLVTTAESCHEAKELYAETKRVFGDISMNIRDWASNDKTFMETIPEKQRSKQTEEIKLLGLIWNLKDDTLELKVNEDTDKNQGSKVTKRHVLKTLARVYDPCGFAAPLVLPAKIMFQDLCVQKVKWDSDLSEEMLKTWNSVLDSLQHIKSIKIPRYMGLKETGVNETVKYELHCFTDASKKAYAAVVYLVAYKEEKINTTFIMSKARITPIENKGDLKIPKLELLGYLIGSRLLKYVKENLNLTIDNQYLWTDSLIVLSWIHSNKLLPPFVSRRVNEIKNSSKVEYRYINTHINPADLATRPELWEQKRRLWLFGPEFLKQNKENWPKNKQSEQQLNLLAGEDLELAHDTNPQESSNTETKEDDIETDFDFDDPREDETKENIRRLQWAHFPEEMRGKVTHLSRNLNLFRDVEGILRCESRMSNTSWEYDMKNPIILPKDSPFTNDLIQKTHETNYHVGASQTLNLIRRKFWIPQGKTQVQKIIRKCPQCIKHGGGPYALPPQPPLPHERVNYTSPFTFTGLDYFGPLYIETATGKEKRWVCLFTCLAIRAIHLEVVRNLTAEECLMALRRFVASRGLPQKIISDNALYFKLTSEVLTDAYCTDNKIKWKFIPQLAPWHGGFYERLVGMVKHCLKRSLEKSLLRDEQLITILKEVEAVLNNRPLTNVGADLEYILKPSDFLSLGKCIEVVPLSTKQAPATKVDLIEAWKRGNSILNEFKRMFSDQYLQTLREKHSFLIKQPRNKINRIPRIGDIVQLKENTKNRFNWKVGKISSLIKGSDGHYRVAKVIVGNKEFTRSIGHLYPLEIESGEESLETRNTPSYSDVPIQEIPIPATSVEDRSDKSIEQSTDEEMQEITDQRVQSPPQQNSHLPSVDTVEETLTIDNQDPPSESSDVVPQTRPRQAAIDAKAKIAEWTRQLSMLLH